MRKLIPILFAVACSAQTPNIMPPQRQPMVIFQRPHMTNHFLYIAQDCLSVRLQTNWNTVSYTTPVSNTVIATVTQHAQITEATVMTVNWRGEPKEFVLEVTTLPTTLSRTVPLGQENQP